MFHPFKIQENGRKRKRKQTRTIRTKKDAEIQSRITLHSHKQFEIILLADDAEFFLLPPRSISVHAASLHFPAGFSAAKSRGFPKLPYSRECTRVSLSLSFCPTDAIMKRAPPILPSPSPVPPFAAQFAREKPASIARDVPALKYFRTCAVKENKNE